MIRIMIVDDMPIFLEYLKGCLDWNQYGFEICCEAKDGREALEKIPEYYPDVVLTDITMPYVNGLELADRIVKDYPNISVILITGNNEFEYARRAVKIGVCDYIVKPFEKQELLLSLMKLQDNINRAQELEKKELREEKMETEDVARTILYSRDQGEVARATEKLAFPGKSFLVCGIQFRANEAQDMELLSNWETVIQDMLSEMIEIDGKFIVFRDYESHIIIVLNFENETEAKGYMGYEFTDLIQIVRNQLSLETSIAISEIYNDASMIRNGYSKVLQTLRIKGPGQVWDCRKREYDRATVDRENEANNNTLDIISAIIHDLHTGNEKQLLEDIDQAWDRINNKNITAPISEEGFASAILSILLTDIITAGLSLKALYGENLKPEYFVASAANTEERKESIKELFLKRLAFGKEGNAEESDDAIQTVKSYMEANFSDPALQISDMVNLVPMNQTYLRKLFKEDTGMTLNEYLTKLRMEKAHSLILETEDKLSDVAESVGYMDVSYFSNCFKKYYGTSPKSLRG